MTLPDSLGQVLPDSLPPDSLDLARHFDPPRWMLWLGAHPFETGVLLLALSVAAAVAIWNGIKSGEGRG